VDFINTDLSGTNLRRAYFWAANLGGANLSFSDCIGATFHAVDLAGADFFEAILNGTNLDSSNLHSASFFGASLGGTILANIDVSETDGLETIQHWQPSTIGIDSLHKSKGKIPKVFLRGCGVPDTMITYVTSLVSQPIQYYSCFISYSSQDQECAERLHADLQNKGVRCWFAPEDLKIGDKFRTRIDEAIRYHDKLLLILSEHSVNSKWVEKEVETAFDKEIADHTVLFPVRLDDAVMKTDRAWAADIRRTRHIGDFSCWKDYDAYQKAFERLLRDLKAESQEP
jgi:hypothetical protein